MTDPKYAAFRALDPFFNIVQQGLAGLVDGDHYFDTIAADAVFVLIGSTPSTRSPEVVRCVTHSLFCSSLLPSLPCR